MSVCERCGAKFLTDQGLRDHQAQVIVHFSLEDPNLAELRGVLMDRFHSTIADLEKAGGPEEAVRIVMNALTKPLK